MADYNPDQAAAEAAQVAALESNTTTDHLNDRPEYDNTTGAMSALDEAGELVRARFLDFLDQFYLSTTSTTPATAIDRNDIDFIYRKQALKITGSATVNDETADNHASVAGGGFSSTLVIDHAHLRSYDTELAEALDNEYVRFEPHLRQAAKEFVQSAHAANQVGDEVDTDVVLPKNQVVFVSVFNLPNVLPIRALRTDQVGRLSSVSGTITRTSDVRPELLSGTFRCEACGLLAENVEQQFQYTTPTICKNPQCSNTSRNKWMLEFDKSIFVDWQRLRVQENSDEIPAGSMPRSLDVIIRGDCVERVKAGDKCTFTGNLVVIPDGSALARAGEAVSSRRNDDTGAGLKGLKVLGVRELTYRTCFVANSAITYEIGARSAGKSILDTFFTAGGLTLSSNDEHFTQAEYIQIQRMKSTPQLYNKMVNSIAPNTFGHVEVKRGVLLMLLGGVHKTTTEGMKLRGDINVCIVGDPSVAKSQFLKYVHGFNNRTVYTSGKASSAAGLTAAVVRDDDTGEYVIEAGALMLADEGICCIDEFDKMDISDQVAIHEAMEQQTISITKAGLQATLNARASILAAANPIYGRYDRSKTLKANVALSAPILSRFDLFFVVLDECDELADYNVAKHILDVHRCEETSVQVPFSKSDLQLYVRKARTLNPAITLESQRVLVECYRSLRQGDTLGRSRSAYRITVRQLESMIRLSEALARLHLDPQIKPSYVREAFRLLKKSIIHVETEDVSFEDDDPDDGVSPAVVDNENLASGETPPASVRHGEYSGKTTSSEGKKEKPKKKKKKKTQITFEQYQAISNSLASHLRSIEDRSNTSEEELPAYISRSEAVNWYLEQCESDIGDSVEELERLKKLTELVIQRLIDKDRVFVYIGEHNDDIPVDQRLIAVHPNFVMD